VSQGPILNSYWIPGELICAGEYPGHDRAAASAGLGALLDAGVRSFVDLTEESDGLRPYDADLRALALERDVEVTYRRLAIRDMDVPPREHMDAILDHIELETAAGRKVYVHCWGGVGRTGTVIGCHLVRCGKDGDAALEAVAELWQFMSAEKRRWHGGSPETTAQRMYVRQWRRLNPG
jgi:hypothetical protein